jgi:hypothetical protein
VSAVAEYVDAPPPINAAPRPALNNDAGLGLVIVSAHLLVTIIIVVSMIVNGQDAWRSALVGAAFFAITVPFNVSLMTGALPNIFATIQHYKTERHRVDAYVELAQLALTWHIESARAQQPQLAAPQEQGTQTPYRTPSVTDSFVAPFADAQSAASEALAWASSLYGSDGQPDRRKVVVEGDNRGWLRVRMLGSARGAGSAEAAQWLHSRRIIMRAQGGFVLNVSRFPTVADLPRE